MMISAGWCGETVTTMYLAADAVGLNAKIARHLKVSLALSEQRFFIDGELIPSGLYWLLGLPPRIGKAAPAEQACNVPNLLSAAMMR
jgi:hypothetical protein